MEKGSWQKKIQSWSELHEVEHGHPAKRNENDAHIQQNPSQTPAQKLAQTQKQLQLFEVKDHRRIESTVPDMLD